MTEATVSITPDGVHAETALEKQRREKIAEQERELAELEKKIPKPAGYHILIALPNIEETFGDSEILKSNQTVRDEYILSIIGCVIDMASKPMQTKTGSPQALGVSRGTT